MSAPRKGAKRKRIETDNAARAVARRLVDEYDEKEELAALQDRMLDEGFSYDQLPRGHPASRHSASRRANTAPVANFADEDVGSVNIPSGAITWEVSQSSAANEGKLWGRDRSPDEEIEEWMRQRESDRAPPPLRKYRLPRHKGRWTRHRPLPKGMVNRKYFRHQHPLYVSLMAGVGDGFDYLGSEMRHYHQTYSPAEEAWVNDRYDEGRNYPSWSEAPSEETGWVYRSGPLDYVSELHYPQGTRLSIPGEPGFVEPEWGTPEWAAMTDFLHAQYRYDHHSTVQRLGDNPDGGRDWLKKYMAEANVGTFGLLLDTNNTHEDDLGFHY